MPFSTRLQSSPSVFTNSTQYIHGDVWRSQISSCSINGVSLYNWLVLYHAISTFLQTYEFVSWSYSSQLNGTIKHMFWTTNNSSGSWNMMFLFIGIPPTGWVFHSSSRSVWHIVGLGGSMVGPTHLTHELETWLVKWLSSMYGPWLKL